MWAHNNAAAADEVAPVVVDDRKPRGCSRTWPWIAGLLRFLGPGGMSRAISDSSEASRVLNS